MLVFYRLWSRKEALIKAIGKGLKISLATFSISLTEAIETISLENATWSLLSLPVDPAFQSAVATNQVIHKITYWEWQSTGPTLLSTMYLPS